MNRGKAYFFPSDKPIKNNVNEEISPKACN